MRLELERNEAHLRTVADEEERRRLLTVVHELRAEYDALVEANEAVDSEYGHVPRSGPLSYAQIRRLLAEPA